MARIDGVSIILTSYNYERYVGKALASAIAQDAPNLEIVVVDNASTDRSWQIIQELARTDARVVAHRNSENIGMIGNHNRGLELASKERVLFLSADDYLLPGHVSRLLEAHERHPGIDYFFTSYVHVDEHDRFKEYLGHIGHLRGTYYGGRNEFADLLSYDVYMCTPTVLLPREMMIERGGFSSAVTTSDYELFLHLASTGATFGFLQTASVAVRMHSEEFTGKDKYIGTGRQLEDHLWILEEYLADRFRSKFAGHENRIVRLLNAKVANLIGYAGGQELFDGFAPRVEALRQRLRELSAESQTAALPQAPLVSVIAPPSTSVDGLRSIRESLERQSYENWELIFASQGAPKNTPLLIERAGKRAKYIEYDGAPSAGTALNDMLALAAGEIVAYGEGDAEWSGDHLRSIVNAFADPRIPALCVPVDLRIDRDDGSSALLPEFYGGADTERVSTVGEAVPLGALAHRTRMLDRAGRFEEQLPYATTFDFVQRLLAQGPLGIPDRPHAVQQSRAVHIGDLPPTDAYLQSLALVYRARPNPASAAPRQQHLQRLAAFLNGPEALRASLADIFEVLRRGPVAPRAQHARDRVVLLGSGDASDSLIAEALREAGTEVVYCRAAVSGAPAGMHADRTLFPPAERMGFVLAAVARETDVFWLADRHYEDLLRAVLDVLGAPCTVILPGERSAADLARREIRYASGSLNVDRVRELLRDARSRIATVTP